MNTNLAKCVLAASLLATAPLSAQASFQIFGTPCAFENEKPTIHLVQLPRLGTQIRFIYRGPNYTFGPMQRIAWPQLGLGLQAQTTPIPPSLLPLQPPGCTGYLRLDALVPTEPDPQGPTFLHHVLLDVPNDPGLIGLPVYAQWLVVVEQCGFAGCSNAALLTSDAVQMVLGI